MSERSVPRDLERSERLARGVVYATAALYGLIFSAAAGITYAAYKEPRFDMGNMVQAVWSTSHGHLLRVTTEQGVEISRLGAHVDPFLVLLVPFWWAWSSPVVLLVLQAFAVSAGAIPVYWLGRKHLQSPRTAGFLAIAYLLYPATQFNAFTPIGLHAVSFAIPLILFAIWYLDEDRLIPFAIFAVLAASTKEEIGAAVGCLGVWYFVRKGQRVAGAVIFVTGFAITFLNMLVVIPHFAEHGASPFAGRYSAVGTTPGGMLHKALSDPTAFVEASATWHKLAFVALLFVPFLGLWRLEPLILLGAAPDLTLDLLSSKPEQSTIFYHYTAGIIPFIVAASVLGAARMKDPRRIVKWVFVLVAALSLISPLAVAAAQIDLARPSNPVHAATKHALSLVPKNDSVSASQSLGAYLSARRHISVFPYTAGARWVVVGKIRGGEDDPAAFRATLARLKRSPAWTVVFESNGITVLKRKIPADIAR